MSTSSSQTILPYPHSTVRPLFIQPGTSLLPPPSSVHRLPLCLLCSAALFLARILPVSVRRGGHGARIGDTSRIRAVLGGVGDRAPIGDEWAIGSGSVRPP
eukprot:5473892-Pyramimonas_sp.AAC.1